MDELDTLHDILFDATGRDITDRDELQREFDSLPNEIHLEIRDWGISDTVVRNRIYDLHTH